MARIPLRSNGGGLKSSFSIEIHVAKAPHPASCVTVPPSGGAASHSLALHVLSTWEAKATRRGEP